MNKEEALQKLTELEEAAAEFRKIIEAPEQTPCELEHLGVYRMSDGTVAFAYKVEDPSLALRRFDGRWVMFDSDETRGLQFPVEKIGKIAVVSDDAVFDDKQYKEYGLCDDTEAAFDPLSLTGKKL